MSKTFEVKCYEKSGEGTKNELIIKCMNNHYEILCTSSVSNRFNFFARIARNAFG